MCVLYSLVFYVEGKTWFITQSCECRVNFQCFICSENIWQFAPFRRVADYNKLYSYYENENSFQSGIQKEHLNFKFKFDWWIFRKLFDDHFLYNQIVKYRSAKVNLDAKSWFLWIISPQNSTVSCWFIPVQTF